jgi:hypothetical protein
MSQAAEFWTEARIRRVEQVLRKEHGDASAEAFLAKLTRSQTIDEKRRLITEELVPALRYGDGIKLWEGREIPTRTVLRDVIQEFLFREGITENVPTNEPDTPEEAAERERLARLFSGGKSAADIVIEDRGPR